ncbi:DegT/DnrJ/EryC1/StrS family aminotransferase [Streptomyces sp. NPDC059092]|uniref:DegT/DnrJ/EryC1/StrS family aminotransferase n=1 Tax=Streptomyces sp. NPDC059092 TaxID=3346725 RepID=UPI0036CDF38F
MINSSRPDARRNASPYLYGQEAAAVAQVLESGQYGHTGVTEEFERGIAAFLGVDDAVAVSSGTAALHIALLVAGIGPGDEVIVPSQTFCATVQAIVACGASPRFVEVSPDTLCVESGAVLEAITPATRAVMPVLYGGRAVDLTAAAEVLGERGITVIEDAAHAFGSSLGTRLVGSTGALTCFSFGPIKNLTCIEGGAIVPRTSQEAGVARRLRTLGITQSQAERGRTTTYAVAGFGLRATLSSVHAAVGSVQLEQFPIAAAKRKALWLAYEAELHGMRNVVLVDVDVDHSVPFNCVVRVPERNRVHATLHAQGIGVGVHYPPNHTQPAFAPWHRPLPVTEMVGEEIMSLPFHPAMDSGDVHSVVSALERALNTVRETQPKASR